jgi:hypothetical protein
MANAQHEVEGYLSHLIFPATKEELINGLLAGQAPARMIALVERLPRDTYGDLHRLREDLEEVSKVHAAEVSPARTYDDFVALVVRHVGDVQHTTKDAFNRVVAHVIHIAERQDILDEASAHAMQQRLESAYVELRLTMSKVFDDRAPIDPRNDMPTTRD